MPVGLIDSALFKDMFGTEPMRRIFSDEGLLQRYLDIEIALARAQARLGMIPTEAADQIARKAKIDNLDMAELKKQTELVGRAILPLVQQLANACEGSAGGYVHWGATTPDIMDTATVLQIRDGLVLIEADLVRLESVLSNLAILHRDTLMIGRTNGQHALPITFGFKIAVWLDEIHRHLQRLREMRDRVLVEQFGGAVGTLASYGGRGLELQAALAQELGLGQPAITWHVARDRICEVVLLLGMISATLGKIANEMWLLTKTEIAELAEPFSPGRGASSTMPQKRNPRYSEAIIGISKMVRQYAAMALDSMVQEHERAGGPWIAQWSALPQAFVLTAGSLNQSIVMLEGMFVDKNRMRENAMITQGMTAAEAVMMELAPHIGRQHAHELVYSACQEAKGNNRPMLDVLAGLPEVSAHLSRDQLAKIVEPEYYLGHAGEFVDRVIAHIRVSKH